MWARSTMYASSRPCDPVAPREYGIPTGELKPCVAVLLDGNLGGAERHTAAFIIAMECRRIGHDEADTERVLSRWARRIGYREARRPARHQERPPENRGRQVALPPRPDSPRSWAAPTRSCNPPARTPVAGCPANCAPLAHLRGDARYAAETYLRFTKLGWPTALRQHRHEAAVDYYRALCELERQRGIGYGLPLFVTYRQLAERAHRAYQKAGAALTVLQTLGLLETFEPGSGSGPHARDRKASLALPARCPFPPCLPPGLTPQSNTGHPGGAHIGHLSRPRYRSPGTDD